MVKSFPISGQGPICLWSLLLTQSLIIQHLTSMIRSLLGRNRQPILGLPSPEQASVGILFGDAGILKPRFVDNVTLYYVENQEYVAVDPTHIDYYVGNEPALPRTPNHLDKDSLLKQEENWRLYQLSKSFKRQG